MILFKNNWYIYIFIKNLWDLGYKINTKKKPLRFCMNYFPLWHLKTSKIVKNLRFQFKFSREGEIHPKKLTLPTKVSFGFLVWSSSLPRSHMNHMQFFLSHAWNFIIFQYFNLQVDHKVMNNKQYKDNISWDEEKLQPLINLLFNKLIMK